LLQADAAVDLSFRKQLENDGDAHTDQQWGGQGLNPFSRSIAPGELSELSLDSSPGPFHETL
jgi:hypothetical protein